VFAAHLAAAGVEFSLGASLGHFDIHTALAQLPAQAWTPAYQARKPRAAEHGVQIEPRDGAWVAEASGLVDLSSWPAGTRLILRKERPHPGAQLRITDAEGLRVTGFLTNTAPGGPARQLADLELHHHRRHARVEDRPQTPRTAGFATCPTTTPPRTRSGWPSPRWPPSCSPRPHASRCPPRRQNWEKTFNTQINKIRYVIEQITDYWRPLATFTTKSQPSWDYISIAPRE